MNPNTQPNQMQQQSATSAGPDFAAVSVGGKLVAVVGYIIPILFFVPYLIGKMQQNQFALFHANQQLVALLVFFVLYLVASFLPIVNILVLLLWLGVLLVGIRNVYKGEMNTLPLVGGITILK